MKRARRNIRDGKVRRIDRREIAAQTLKDHKLETIEMRLAAAVLSVQVAGIVPPLGEIAVRRFILRKAHRRQHCRRWRRWHRWQVPACCNRPWHATARQQYSKHAQCQQQGMLALELIDAHSNHPHPSAPSGFLLLSLPPVGLAEPRAAHLPGHGCASAAAAPASPAATSSTTPAAASSRAPADRAPASHPAAPPAPSLIPAP